MNTPAKTRRIPRVLLLVESSRESGRALLRGIANYSHHHGPWSFYWEPGGFEKAWPNPRELGADGIILRDVGEVDEALACGLPAVVIGHRHAEIPGLVNVVTDSEAIGRMGAEHLVNCGFKHFAFCGYARTPVERPVWSEERRGSFTAYLSKAGFGRPPYYVLSKAKQDWRKERVALARWLRSLRKPVGLLACNDDCGQQVMDACKLAGLAVPDQIGVIGADNDEVVCGLTDPPLSSVAINFERAGYDAAQALDQLMRGHGKVPSRILAAAPYIVTRRSTDFVAAEEPTLTRALRFIRDKAPNGVSVDEVAQASGLSRRALEKQFRTLLSRSILQEIHRVRTDHIAQLLVETDLPVTEIAARLGFEQPHHFARYFSAVKQISPLRYRRKHSHHVKQSGLNNGRL